MKTIWLSSIVLFLLGAGILAFLFLFGAARAARERDEPAPPAALGQDSPGSTDCLLARLGLTHKETCGKVCPLKTCRGRSKLMRMVCSLMDKVQR